MAIPSSIPAMERFIRSVDILVNIPDVQISTLSLEDSFCFCCQDLYDLHAWQRKGKADHPVEFICGHRIGFQCLVRWILSSPDGFDSRCPLCRAQIVPETQEPSDMGFDLATRLLRIAALVDHRHRKSYLPQYIGMMKQFTESASWASSNGANKDRVMIISEEYLTRCCEDPLTGPAVTAFDLWTEVHEFEIRRRERLLESRLRKMMHSPPAAATPANVDRVQQYMLAQWNAIRLSPRMISIYIPKLKEAEWKYILWPLAIIPLLVMYGILWLYTH